MNCSKFFKYLVVSFSIIFCSLSSGCQKASINGDLDGRWQIVEFEENGIVTPMKDSQLYYSFYMHVCNLSFYGGIFTEGNFNFSGSTLYMDFPHVKTAESYKYLKEYGIFSNPVEFKVTFLNKEKLILKEGDFFITLRKF